MKDKPAPNVPTPQLNLFRERVRALYRLANPYDDGRRPTQEDLAAAVGLARAELSSRLNGSPKARLTERDAKAIVRTLCDWGAITTQAEATELLTLAGFANFTAAEWQAPPLDLLTAPLSMATAVQRKQPHGNLPPLLVSLIDREEAQASVAQLLTTNRLVTLCGPGGVGKSILALAVGHILSSRFANGVYLVELASLSNASQLVPAICRAIGVLPQADQSPLDTLRAALAETNALLLLDCCEHLIDDVAVVASQMLAGCPNLRLLTTSRELLRVVGEVAWEVPTLGLPQLDPSLTPAVALRYAAIRLFCERAAAAAGGFRLTQSKLAAVHQICSQLDGLPLAIELAAARVRLLSVEQIQAQLSDRFRLLAEGRRAGDPRHQTLRTMIDWSYRLLSSSEQATLRRLGLFSQDFSLEAVEAVAGGESQVAEASSLMNKSLLRRRPAADDEQEPRFALLETIRDYAHRELVAVGEEAAAYQHHAAYFLQIAEAGKDEQQPQRRQQWLERLEAERDNMRTALYYLLQQGGAADDKGARLAVALSGFWFVRGYWAEGQQVLDTVVAQGAAQPTRLRANALHAAALFSGVRGYHEQAIAGYKASLTIYRQLADEADIAKCCSNLGTLLMEQGDYEAAKGYLQESLAIRQMMGNPMLLSNSIEQLASVALAQGDYPTAERLTRSSLAMREQLGDQRRVASSMISLGAALLYQEQYAEAHQLLSTALASVRSLNFRERITIALRFLGDIAYKQADYPLAASLYRQSLRLRQEMDNLPGIFNSLEAVANAEAMQGRTLLAARLAGAAAALSRSHKLRRAAADEQFRVEAEKVMIAQFGSASFEQHWAAGSRLSLTEAVQAALAGFSELPVALETSLKSATAAN